MVYNIYNRCDNKKQFFLNTYFYEKKLHCIQQLRCTAKLDRFHAIYLVLTKNIIEAKLSNILVLTKEKAQK